MTHHEAAVSRVAEELKLDVNRVEFGCDCSDCAAIRLAVRLQEKILEIEAAIDVLETAEELGGEPNYCQRIREIVRSAK